MITKKDMQDVVQKVVLEATDTILDGVQGMFDEQHKANNQEFAKVNGRIDALSTEVKGLKDEIDGIKADISTVPTRKEFTQLKSKVDKFAFA